MEEQCINSEQAFDMLPYVADIYEKTDFDNYRKQLANKFKGKEATEIDYAIDATKYILKNSKKIKAEFFMIVSIAEKKTLDQVKKQSFIKTAQSIKRIFSDPDLVDFFKQAMP